MANTISSGIVLCDECDAEFEVIPACESYDEISFCPFCGSELVGDEDFDEDEEYDD